MNNKNTGLEKYLGYAKHLDTIDITHPVQEAMSQLLDAMSTTGYAYADISTSEND
ncbi:hypothetical protein [Nostoc sp.]